MLRLLLVAILLPSRTGLIAILATSFFLSLMFPTIFALGLKDLGPNTNIAGSFFGDGDRGRCGHDAPDGRLRRVASQHFFGIPDSALRQPGYRRLFLLHDGV